MDCKKPCKADQICNPKSGRCVSRTGKIGKTLKSRSQRKKSKSRSLNKSPHKKSRSLSKSACKKPCKADQICNPSSGRCVLRSGKIGKSLIALKKSPKRKSRSPVKSPKRKSRSPVKSPKRKSRSPVKSPKRKSRSPVKSPKRKSRSLGKSPKKFIIKTPEEYYGRIPKNVTKAELADIMAKGLKKLAEHSDATNGNIYNPLDPINDLLRWITKWIIKDTKETISRDLVFKPTDDGESDDYGKEFFDMVRIKLKKLFKKYSPNINKH
jgi:hypothetical protein